MRKKGRTEEGEEEDQDELKSGHGVGGRVFDSDELAVGLQ